MAWFIGQSLPVILAAFSLGMLAGWFVWGNRKSTPSPAPNPSAAVPAEGDATEATPRDSVAGPQRTQAYHVRGEEVPHVARLMTTDRATSTEVDDISHDDLERIEGIGPKMAAALRSAGIHSFGQLARTDDDTRRAAIEAAGLSFAPSLVTWGRQAQLLADGDEDAFVELTQRLVAGRDTGRA